MRLLGLTRKSALLEASLKTHSSDSRMQAQNDGLIATIRPSNPFQNPERILELRCSWLTNVSRSFHLGDEARRQESPATLFGPAEVPTTAQPAHPRAHES